MKYTCEWTEQKTGASGKTYYEVSLTAEDGTKIPKATTFDQLTAGTAYDGEIVINGKYTNFKKAGDPNIMGARPAWAKKENTINKAMERKEGSIEKFQTSKENSIKIAGATRGAVDIVVAKMRHQDMPDEQITAELAKWQKTVYSMYDQPFI